MPTLDRAPGRLLRALRRNPAFFTTTILTLTLGMGATLALFTLIRGLILKPLPYPHADRMVRITSQYEGRNWGVLSLPDIQAFQARSSTLEDLAFLAGGPHTHELGGRGRGEPVQSWAVSWNLLPLLGAHPVQGRFFGLGEQREHAPVVVLTHAFWIQAFGGDPRVIGKPLWMDGKAYTILGVTPAGLILPLPGRTDCFTPPPPGGDTRESFWLRAVGLRRPDRTLPQLQADLHRIGGGLVAQFPEQELGWSYSAEDLHAFLLRNHKSTLFLLMGASALVLLIACANVANLFLARALHHRQENALRAALGASPSWRLRHHLAEGLAVGLSAGVLGTALAWGAIHILPGFLPGLQSMAGVSRPAVDPVVLGVALALSLGTSLGFALVPLMQVREANLNEALQAMGRTSRGPGRRTRGLLVVAQSALAVLVLSLGGLFFHSFWKVTSIHPGFRYRGLLTFHVNLPESRYATPESRGRFQAELMKSLESLPGQPAVSVSTTVPFGGGTNSMRCHEVPTQRPESAWPIVVVEGISEGYFRTLGIPILKGRPILASDSAEGPKVAVINEACARLLFPGEDPVGRHHILALGSPGGIEYDIVGVSRDTRQGALFSEPEPRVFYPLRQLPTPYLNVILRSKSTPGAMRKTLEDRIWALDPSLPVRDLERVEDLGRAQLGSLEQTLRLLAVFAALGLVITAFGIYSVVSYHMVQRRREIGIRMALGADRRRLLRMILAQDLRLAFGGALLGTLSAWGIGRLVQHQLFQVSAADPLAITLAWMSLGLAGTLATLLPALQATAVDPATALRTD